MKASSSKVAPSSGAKIVKVGCLRSSSSAACVVEMPCDHESVADMQTLAKSAARVASFRRGHGFPRRICERYPGPGCREKRRLSVFAANGAVAGENGQILCSLNPCYVRGGLAIAGAVTDSSAGPSIAGRAASLTGTVQSPIDRCREIAPAKFSAQAGDLPAQAVLAFGHAQGFDQP